MEHCISLKCPMSHAMGRKGIFIQKEDSTEYLLYGQTLSRGEQVSIKQYTKGILGAFSIIRSVDYGAEVKPLEWLHHHSNEIPEGKVFMTFIHSQRIFVIKDTLGQVEMASTVSRQVGAHRRRDLDFDEHQN